MMILSRLLVSLKLESLGDKIDQKISDFYRVSQPARTLGRLVLEARSRRPEVKLDLDYLLKPENFDFLIQCTKYMSHKRDEPVLTLGRLIGNLIGHVIQVKIGLALRQNNDVKNREASNFQKLYESEWNFRVNAICTKKYNIKKRQNIQTIPITEDLKKLRNHIMAKMRSTGDTLSALPNIESWNCLNKLTLVRIILFNKRRRAEVTELKVDDFINRPNWKEEMNGEISLALTESDRILANRMDMMISGGKSRKNVDAYVLFPPDCMKALNILMETRSSVGIRTSNNYLFARPLSDTPLSGHTDIKDVVNECSNLKCPERITSTSLRKYAATVSQILDMTPKEIETLATHLGHDVNTHKNFYRLHSSTIELSKVSHMLLAMEGGHMNVWKGKKLEDINILDLPGEALECDDKSDDDDISCKDVPDEVMNCNDIDEVENEIEEVISCKDNQACERSKDNIESINHTDDTESIKVKKHSKRKRSEEENNIIRSKDNLESINHTDDTESIKVKKHSKRKWSEEENNIIKKKFRIQIEKNVTVTNDELLEVQKTLNNRSLAMIRSKINNMKFGKCN
ncbi:hypothetical protein LOTGIDRAFT_166454 [Lottia gigantea]|uniref:Uncharacterized protein n=1 Tax=Lottia gigantea TaxID=225164 RepID=V4BF99_LOTGI|nr:hypothetical protein LOTGIDRAFT_166454 [Lottia gigantea]ESO87574.1 hypothetical protein LOTGIDRAFT_166454 [Lottia gigantea]